MLVLDSDYITNYAPKCPPRELRQNMASLAKWVTNMRQSIKTLVEQIGRLEGENPKVNC
tara:strand:- start:49 stop:225 length:177 start_codon:yes stop_codon:yes gene_type:complete